MLAIEDTGPIEALKGSARLVKSKWGEGLTGLVGIGAWTAVVVIPVGILIGVGVATNVRHPASGPAMIVGGAIALILVSAMAGATRQVFSVALYRYATGRPSGGFATADLERPFALKGKRGHGGSGGQN